MIPSAPCPAAGRQTSGSSTSVTTSSLPRRVRPASARSVASTTPSRTLRMRVSTLPRSGTISRSGRLPQELRGAARGSRSDHRTLGQGRSSVTSLARDSTSRGSSRTGTQQRVIALLLPRGQVLQAVHGRVDPVFAKRLVELGREHARAAERRELGRPIGVAAARHPDERRAHVRRAATHSVWVRASGLAREPSRSSEDPVTSCLPPRPAWPLRAGWPRRGVELAAVRQAGGQEVALPRRSARRRARPSRRPFG